MTNLHTSTPLRLWIILCLVPLLFVWAALTGLDLAAAPPRQLHAPTDLILVGVMPGISYAEAASLFAAQGMTLARFWPDFDLAAVRPAVMGRASDATLAAALAQVQTLPAVRFAELDGWIESAQADAPFTPNDPNYPQQWALPKIRMPDAWNITQGDPSLVIAVIDSGVELTHDDLSFDNIWANPAEATGQVGVDDDNNGFVDDLNGWDWVDEDNSPRDLFGHGTHVAGTMIAQIDNGIGVAGMSAALRIMPLRVLDNRGSGAVSSLIDALAYARSHGAQIINLSLVLRFDPQPLKEAIRYLYDDDILVVAATGNYGNQVYWPARYTETLAIAAVDQIDERAIFSNAGPETDVAAPGVDILSTYKENGYNNQSGTSMATPHVAALAALIWSLRPDLDRAGVIDLILSTAVDVNAASYPGFDPNLGHGRIDAAAALNRAAQAIDVDVQLPAGVYLSVGQPFHLPIRLTVTDEGGALLPIRGAVVHVELRGPSAGGGVAGAIGKQVAAERLISDESGYLFFDVTLPAQAGQYTLLAALGAHVQAVDLRIQDGPLLLSILPSAPSMTVGSGNVDIVIGARTHEDEPYTEDLAITLRTSLGRFVDGNQSRALIMSGGMLTETLYAGTGAGTAELILEAAGQSHRITVLLKPDVPYRLSGPNEIWALNFGRGATLDLDLTLYDRFGNQVWESHAVNFYSMAGRFSPESPRAVNGEVSTQFEIGPWATAPQPIWAMIPGTFAIYRAEVKLLSKHLYLPLVQGVGD